MVLACVVVAQATFSNWVLMLLAETIGDVAAQQAIDQFMQSPLVRARQLDR